MNKKDSDKHDKDAFDILGEEPENEQDTMEDLLDLDLGEQEEQYAETYKHPFIVGDQSVEMYVHRLLSNESNVSVGIHADMTIHLEVPEDYDLDQVEDVIELLRPKIEEIYQQTVIANDRVLAMWVLRSLDEAQGILMFGELYPIHYLAGEWYKPYYRVWFEDHECLLTIPDGPLDVERVVLTLAKELQDRLLVVFEGYLNQYLTRFEELPAKMPILDFDDYQPYPVVTNVNTGLITLNSTLSQFPEGYVEYCAASALCRLIDLGNQELHDEYMDKVMPDWREWIKEFPPAL